MNEEFHHDRDDELMTTQEVARMCNVTSHTVRRWITDGKLRSVKIGEGRSAHHRLRRGDVLNLMKRSM